MTEVEQGVQFDGREAAREKAFESIWTNDLEEVFADVAEYYDRANFVASFGTFNRIKSNFISTFDLKPQMRVLDVCAGTHAVGIALLKQQPGLQIRAIDRSSAMLEVGAKMAQSYGFNIEAVKGDVHRMPFPDNYFDIATIQYASRHLRLIDVFSEIKRILKPGGYFYHCDMLRPQSKLVEELYYIYLRSSLTVTAWLFDSGQSALKCRKYFIDAVKMFYSADEMSQLMREVGFRPVISKSIMMGMIAFHKAMKPLDSLSSDK